MAETSVPPARKISVESLGPSPALSASETPSVETEFQRLPEADSDAQADDSREDSKKRKADDSEVQDESKKRKDDDSEKDADV